MKTSQVNVTIREIVKLPSLWISQHGIRVMVKVKGSLKITYISLKYSQWKDLFALKIKIKIPRTFLANILRYLERMYSKLQWASSFTILKTPCRRRIPIFLKMASSNQFIWESVKSQFSIEDFTLVSKNVTSLKIHRRFRWNHMTRFGYTKFV